MVVLRSLLYTGYMQVRATPRAACKPPYCRRRGRSHSKRYARPGPVRRGRPVGELCQRPCLGELATLLTVRASAATQSRYRKPWLALVWIGPGRGCEVLILSVQNARKDRWPRGLSAIMRVLDNFHPSHAARSRPRPLFGPLLSPVLQGRRQLRRHRHLLAPGPPIAAGARRRRHAVGQRPR